METLEVPESVEALSPETYDQNPVAFADFVLTSLFHHAPALLHAEYRHPEESVTWFIQPESDGRDLPIAVSSSRSSFRSVLARFGHHYLSDQLYNGYALRFLRQHNRSYRCYIYMSNGGQPGFWIRVYGAVA
jgi:hypothetical protein